jgi:CysZ protein
MLKEIIISIQAFFEAHRFIAKQKMWKWIIIPGLSYSLLFCLGMYFFWTSSSYLIETLMIKTGLKEWLFSLQNSWWLNALVIFAQFILHLVLILFYFSLFKYLFLIFASPIFALLSEKTAAILEGKDFPFSPSQLVKDILRGIRLALRNLLWQTVYTLSILLISFIPVVGWIMPLVALLVECYYFGFSMLDYSCERNKLSTSQSISFIGKHKGLAIGNGLVFYLMHLLPIIGWVLAPSYAVIAATISLYKTKNIL